MASTIAISRPHVPILWEVFSVLVKKDTLAMDANVQVKSMVETVVLTSGGIKR